MMNQKVKNIATIPFYEKMYPFELLVYLLMGSSAILFFVLVSISVFSKTIEPASISLYFLLSTSTLLFSSKFSFRMEHLFEKEDWAGIRNSVLILTLSGCLFIILQYLGWQQMSANAGLNRFNDFFYLLCGLHVFHIVIMILYSSSVFRRYLKISMDPIYALLIQANPVEARKISLLSQCWLYLDVIWIIILLAFSLS